MSLTAICWQRAYDALGARTVECWVIDDGHEVRRNAALHSKRSAFINVVWYARAIGPELSRYEARCLARWVRVVVEMQALGERK